MSWSSRKQALIGLGVLIVLILLIGIPVFFSLHEEPTCFDGIQNDLEDGVDCGGSCEKVCSFQAVEPIVHWARLFEVVPSVYSVVALVENPNTGIETGSVPYTFALRDERNILITQARGTLNLLPRAIVPVFQTNIRTGERVPQRVFFEFDTVPDWKKTSQTLPDITVSNQLFSPEDVRLTAQVNNNESTAVSDIAVVALVYDGEDNAIAASRTIVEQLLSGESRRVVFTWPRDFEREVVRVDIVPVVEL